MGSNVSCEQRRVWAYLPVSLVAQLAVLADRHHRNISQEITVAIEAYIGVQIERQEEEGRRIQEKVGRKT